MIWLAVSSFAGDAAPPAGAEEPAGAPPVPDLEEVIGYGVRVDWTHLTLEVQTDTVGKATQTIEAVEQLGRREVDAAFQQAVGRVRVTSAATLGALVADPVLGSAVQSRIPRWEVTEVVYGTSGRVALHASLSLQDLLKPWTMQIAKAGTVPPPAPNTPTGLLIEARGTGAKPAFCPRLLDEGGRLLYSGELYEEQAVTLAPYVYVPDPAHPAAARAGHAPVWVKALRADGSDLVLDGDGAARVAELSETLLGRGEVVVVVDAP